VVAGRWLWLGRLSSICGNRRHSRIDRATSLVASTTSRAWTGVTAALLFWLVLRVNVSSSYEFKRLHLWTYYVPF
jgi:hypothetical protein